MQLALEPSSPRRPAERRNANFLLALAFWAFTYALFTYRANLRYGDAYELVSMVRLVPTLLGAGLYWLVLSKLIDGTRDGPGKPLAVIATILPASIVVLLARILLDELGAPNPNGFSGDLRFVMVWGGYFGLWASASFALRVIPRLGVGSLARAASIPRHRAIKAVASKNGNAIVRAEMLERLALEVASLPAAERRALLEAFATPRRYETADEFEMYARRDS